MNHFTHTYFFQAAEPLWTAKSYLADVFDNKDGYMKSDIDIIKT